jgi:hypothetical protein
MILSLYQLSPTTHIERKTKMNKKGRCAENDPNKNKELLLGEES